MTAILPVNIDFITWASQLRNTYPTQEISRVSSEKDWKRFPAMLRSNRCFEDSVIPDVGGFKDWREWASEFNFSIGA